MVKKIRVAEDEIERAVKEAALQHFKWSWWEIENTKN